MIRKRREQSGGIIPQAVEESSQDQILHDALTRARHDDARLKECRLEALDRHHVGLSFSGGGIRSATFAVGILQGLAGLGLLQRFDYLSTVSGGGYAGGWLAAWLKRDGDPANVETQLSPGRVANARANRDDWGQLLPPSEVIDEEPEPIFHLREYSSYLTPRPGLMSADTWTIIAIWLRNVLINLLVLLPATVLVVVLARFVVFLYSALWVNSRNNAGLSWYSVAIFILGLVLMTWSVGVNGLVIGNFRRRSMPGRERLRGWFVGQKLVSYAIVWPMLTAAVLLSVSFRQIMPWLETHSIVRWSMRRLSIVDFFEVGQLLRLALGHAFCFGALLGGLTFAMGVVFKTRSWPQVRAATLGGMAGGLFALFCEILIDRLQHSHHGELVATFMPAMALLVVVISIFVEVALLGRTIEEAEREWWGRLTGLYLIVAIGWVVSMASILFIPLLFLYAESSLVRAAIAAGWLGTTASGVLAARSVMSSLKTESASWRLSVLAGVAPPIFLIGLLGGCSLLTAALLREVRLASDSARVVIEIPAVASRPTNLASPITGHTARSDLLLTEVIDDRPEWRRYLLGLTQEDNLIPLLQLASFAFLATSIGLYLIDVNLFSLHAMYANRLTRAYLGASRSKRRWEGRWGYPRVRLEGGGGPIRTSPPPRDENPVTGFDADDDIPLMDLKIGSGPPGSVYWGPHLLINTALNLVGGKELAWRNRQSESFVLSPVYCGSKGTGYGRLTVKSRDKVLSQQRRDLAKRRNRLNRYKKALMTRWAEIKAAQTRLDPEDDQAARSLAQERSRLDLMRGKVIRHQEIQAREQLRLDRKIDAKQLTLGRAIAISGAAVDPNMNLYQSQALTALLTIFNARLGYWMQNPYHEGWSAKGPIYGGLLRDEFFGETDDKGKYIHLSDGGHFENLGVYELIRRRCRYVVACDAGEDGSASDENLANLVRLCRTDFGVRIQLDTTPLRINRETGLAPVHVVIGRICYDDVDRGEMLGILVYIKISLTGDEPSDMQNYADLHPEFPHQATDLRQTFDDAQFESYRALGDHIARSVFENAVESLDAMGHPIQVKVDATQAVDAFHNDHIRGTQRLFSAVRNRWVDSPPALGDGVAALNRSSIDFQRQLRQDPRLVDLTSEIYPELFPNHADRETNIPPAERRRAELHAVGQMLQIMEDAWEVLGMKGHKDLPVNRGWMNVFHRWASSATFHRLWPSLRPEFSPEFVQFCEGRLHLVAARPTLRRASAFDLDRLTTPADQDRDTPKPHTLDFEVASIRQLALEFEREWPTEGPARPGTFLLDPEVRGSTARLDQDRRSPRIPRKALDLADLAGDLRRSHLQALCLRDHPGQALEFRAVAVERLAHLRAFDLGPPGLSSDRPGLLLLQTRDRPALPDPGPGEAPHPLPVLGPWQWRPQQPRGLAKLLLALQLQGSQGPRQRPQRDQHRRHRR